MKNNLLNIQLVLILLKATDLLKETIQWKWIFLPTYILIGLIALSIALVIFTVVCLLIMQKMGYDIKE